MNHGGFFGPSTEPFWTCTSLTLTMPRCWLSIAVATMFPSTAWALTESDTGCLLAKPPTYMRQLQMLLSMQQRKWIVTFFDFVVSILGGFDDVWNFTPYWYFWEEEHVLNWLGSRLVFLKTTNFDARMMDIPNLSLSFHICTTVFCSISKSTVSMWFFWVIFGSESEFCPS